MVPNSGGRNARRRPRPYRFLFHVEKSLGATIYEATSSRRTRSLAKELTTGAVASVFLGFGSLFLLLSSGVYV
ncbi:hypothetical protein G4B88_013737 [Cannabis sativa]|uniref:Dolichyl-diphosphooligosaccharide-protein glycosyltransferase subunit OST5 n=1 Tax=Cannabis sativa TaxID=3483 RepID=A0A7J6HVA5_CANSA|nr:hypothetical protein G4B88_013737 [Cannabis sativa]